MNEYIIIDVRRQIQIIFVVIASVFIFSLDFSMVNISLPTISGYFHTIMGAAAFLPTAYMIVVTSSLLGFGKIGDLKGYKIIFIGGLTIFTIGSLLCSFAPTLNILVAIRMFQALGEAMMSPMSVAIITTFLPVRMRGLSLGLVSLAQGLGFAGGNVLGGVIDTHFSWRAIFLVNIPIAVIAIFLALKALPSEQKKSADKRFDWPGAALIFVGLAGLVYGLNLLGRLKSSPAEIWAGLIIAAIGLGLFIMRERKTDCPLLDFALFKNRDFTYSNLAAFSVVAVLMGCIFIAPFYLQMLKGLSVMRTGLYLMIAPLAMLFVAPFAGKVSDHIDSRIICSIGALLGAAAFGILAALKVNDGLLPVGAALFTLGVGSGLFMAPNNKLVMSHAPEDRQGVASGVYKICLSIGGVFGIAIFPIVVIQSIIAKIGRQNVNIDLLKNSPDILQIGFHNMFISAILIALAAFVFSILAKDSSSKSRDVA